MSSAMLNPEARPNLQLTRRQFLQAAALIPPLAFLAACGPRGKESTPSTAVATKPATSTVPPMDSSAEQRQRIEDYMYLENTGRISDVEYSSPLVGGNWVNPKKKNSEITLFDQHMQLVAEAHATTPITRVAFTADKIGKEPQNRAANPRAWYIIDVRETKEVGGANSGYYVAELDPDELEIPYGREITLSFDVSAAGKDPNKPAAIFIRKEAPNGKQIIRREAKSIFLPPNV